MKVYFVRHGETNYNVADLCNDDPRKDVYLTEKGRQQAETLAVKLKSNSFEYCIISELPRTRETAEILNQYHDVPIYVDSRINDRRTGFDSKPVPEFFAAVERAPDKFAAKFNDGESFNEEKERVVAFLKDLSKRAGGPVFVVAHSEIMKIIYGYFHRLSDEEAWSVEVNNAQVLEFDLPEQ